MRLSVLHAIGLTAILLAGCGGGSDTPTGTEVATPAATSDALSAQSEAQPLGLAGGAGEHAIDTRLLYTRARVGVSMPGTGLAYESQADLDHDMAMVAATGAKWVRFDIAAVQIEATNGVRYWSNIDRMITSARAHGLQVLGILTTLPAWSARSWDTGPTTMAQLTAFTNFAAAAVARYPQVTYWEVWNEPNNPAFWTGPSSTNYAFLLKATYAVIKAANPTARVLMGGTAGGQSWPNDTVSWVTALYANGGKAFFDIANLHPYPDGVAAGPTSGEMSHIAAVRAVMAENNDSTKPLWGTECGFPTGGANSTTEAIQATFIPALFNNWVTATGAQRGPLFIYALRDNPGAADREAHFGIVHSDFTVKPAYAAVTAISRR